MNRHLVVALPEQGAMQPVAARESVQRQSLFAVRSQAASEVKPDLLMYALAVLIWTYVWRVQDLFPVLGTFKINLLSAALAIGLFALDRNPARRIGRLKTPILFCACALLGIAVLGLPFSLWPSRSASFLLREVVPNVVLMVLLAASVRGVRDLEWIALINALGACAYAVFVHMNFDVSASGRLNDLIYYDANELALVLVCTIPFALFFLVRGGLGYRLLGLLASMLLVMMVVKSGSRGGFLAFVAVLAYVLIRYRAIPKRVRLLAVVGCFALLSVIAGDAYWEKVGTLRNPQEDYNWSGRSTEGRVEVWKRGLGYMAARPLLGVGVRNFPLAEGTLSKESKASVERGRGFKWGVAHNSFVEIGAELGVIGLGLFVAMLISCFRVLRTIGVRLGSDRAARSQVALAGTLGASLVGFIVAGFFLSAQHFSYLYLLFAMVMGFSKISSIGQRSNKGPRWTASAALRSRLDAALIRSSARRSLGPQRTSRRMALLHSKGGGTPR